MLAGYLQILLYAAIPLGVALSILVGARAVQSVRMRRMGARRSLLRVYRGSFALALAVLAGGLALSVQMAETARQKSLDAAQQRFLEQAEMVETSFQELVGELVHPLDIVHSVFVANPDISREAFAQVIALNLRDGHYSGVRGFGFVERVSATDLPAFVAAQRAAGTPDFPMPAPTGNADYLITKYVAPSARNSGALGQDIGADPILREAAQDAVHRGITVMSRRTVLVQDELRRPAFVIFMPLYAGGAIPDRWQDRERLLRGWIMLPVVVSELMSSGSTVEQKMANFQLFDQEQETLQSLVYDSESPAGEASGPQSLQRPGHSLFSLMRPLLTNDHVFYLRTNSTPAFEQMFMSDEYLRIAAIGSCLSLLLATVLWLLMVGRARAIDLSVGMTASLNRMALVAQRTSNAVMFSDADGIITWVNEGFSRITGYVATEVVGQHREAVLRGPDLTPALLERMRAQADAGAPFYQLVQCARNDGALYWAHLEMQAIFDAHRRVEAYMTVQSDVTGEVKAKAALVIEKERTQEILSGANVGTWEANLVTGESMWNDRWSGMMGFSSEEVQPDAESFWRTRVHPDDRVRVANAEAVCLHGGADGYACDVRVQRKDGSFMWIMRRARVMTRLRDGAAEWIGGIHTDISGFKQVENSLRDMETFLDRAGRIAGVGAWKVDLRTDVVTFSDQTCILHGVEPGYRPTRAEALAYFLPPDRVRLEQAIDRALAEGTGWDLELEFRNALGTLLWVRHFGEVEFDDAGAAHLVGAFQDVTQDYKARMLVQRSSELLRGAIDAINEAFVLYDPQDRLVFCNDKYRALHVQSADLMIVGASLESILRGAAQRGQYPQALGRVDAWVEERLQEHRQGDISLEQKTSDGRWLKVVQRKMPDGHSVGFRVDITELKMATAAAESVSAALAEERLRLRNILEGTNVGTWEFNVQTGETIYNDQYSGMLGYAPEALAQGGYDHWVTLTHPSDAALAAQKMAEHLSEVSPLFEHEMRVRHADGRWIWLLARGKLARYTDDGRPWWVYGTHMDITERKLAEQELAVTSATLQNVLDSATHVGVICTGINRVVQIFNRGAENLTGYSAGEMVNLRTCSPFFELNELAVVRESLELMFGRTPTTQEVFDHVVSNREQQEWTFIRKDGSRFIASLIFSPMHNVQGELTGHLAIVYDVSRQKEYETSLRQAMMLAEQSSVAKSQFLANMSHEIRTPMNAILGMLQLLNRTTLDLRQHDYTDKAEVAARSLLGLLNDILDFSKVEAGKMQIDPEPFHLEELLSDLSVILSSNLGKKKVDLLYDIDPAIPRELIGDSLRLKQILINLGGNAVKFTQEGEVMVRWRLLNRTPEWARISVSVHDTGIGIAPENQTRIFEAFTQAESNTTRRFGGTGLGLVICTRLIRLMGGELELHSVEGEGSVFSFVLDLPVVADSPGALPHTPPGPVRAMLVDDNAQAREAASAMLGGLGWDVVAVESGDRALALLHSDFDAGRAPPAVVFVDWEMPQMDGWETLCAIRGLYGEGPHPLLVLMSRHNREALAGRSVQEQEWLNGFMVKPLTAGMFEQTLAQARLRANDTHAQRAPAEIALRLLGMRILLVEDNLINQQVAQELLNGVGAEVTLADNGQCGLDALAAAEPMFDVVLMDLQMPVMDGLTATRRIREDRRYDALPVIAMTANAMAGDREACLAAGMNDHVGKPFDLGDLIRTLIVQTGWIASAAVSDGPLIDIPVAPLGNFTGTVDVATALARMGGNRGLLGRSMHAYIAEAEQLPQRLGAYLLNEDSESLRRELHSFKGLSATLGVGSLYELAASAEQLLRDRAHANVRNAAISALQAQVLQLLPTLRSVADVLTEQPHAAPAFPTQGLPLTELRQLANALQASDMGAMAMHAELRLSAAPPLATQIEALDAAMSALDFAHAAELCVQLIAAAEAMPS